METLNSAEKRLLLHMTGSDKKQGQGWRNYGAFTPGSPDHSLMLSLQTRGLVKHYLNAPKTWGALEYFYVTKAGCEAAGMTKAGTKRAVALTTQKGA